MPVLPNPRHEAFAQAIFAGLSRHQNYSQAQAYRDAGYKVTNGNSARACASRLLTFANGVSERIHELQAEQLARITPKLDVSKETIGRRLRLASDMAERQENPTAIVNSELAIAKVFHKIEQPDERKIDFADSGHYRSLSLRLTRIRFRLRLRRTMRLLSGSRRFAIGLRRLPSSSFPSVFLLPLVIRWLG
jgi:hypothetical protein